MGSRRAEKPHSGGKTMNGTEVIRELRKHPSIEEILTHPLFLSMSQYRHHANVSCLEHSLAVAVTAYHIAKGRKADMVSVIRGALLHDFYLYDWHTDSPGLHGFKHPYIALANATRHFELNRLERDAIVKHMFPMTPFPPKYIESFIVMWADKAVSFNDYFRKKKKSLTLSPELTFTGEFRSVNTGPAASIPEELTLYRH